MRRRDFLQGVAALAAGAAGLNAAAGTAHAATLAPDPFYGLAFPDLQGKTVQLDSYLGKTLVANFWATWCAPCVKEMPDLDALHKKYPGINVVGLAIDTASNVEKFGSKVQVSYPLLVAGHGGIQHMRALGNKNGGLPFTVIFDSKGGQVKTILGQVDPNELDRLLAGLA
jgi:thiol-disulfide isomerase/thioredoxin